jgi:ribosomal protein S18 acetylase RimI-like enzyme
MKLENPAWHALRGAPPTVAEGGPLAFRYRTDVAVFAGVPDELTPDAWDALRELIGPGEVAILVREQFAAPEHWEQVFSLPAVQMVATAVEGAIDDEAARLSTSDVAEMLALVERARPGPFAPRTIDLGEYFGFRDASGALVAMAGERLFPAPYREISAVCTDETHRGKGFAARLVRHMIARIQARGETPMLHAADDNTNAIRLYETLGFTHARTLMVSGYRAPN